MYKLFTDKTELFECNVKLEGASLKSSIARIIIESEDVNLLFNGTITFVYRSFNYTGTLPSTFGSYLVSNTITLPPYVYFYIV